MPSLQRVSLVLALLAGLSAGAQPLPPPEPSSVSSGMPAAAPAALPSEAPKPDELQPSGPVSAPDAGAAGLPPPADPAAALITPAEGAPSMAEPPPVPPPVVEQARPVVSPGKAAFESRVEAPAPTSAASAETIRDRDLQLRFYPTPEDILRVVPGLVIAQHQGGGKADQLFLRGFDADHGTDVALYIDGVPINLPSNGHGQGFADLHFLIPETVDRVEVTKGPYFVETGDFDTAGAINLRTRRTFGENSVSGEYGSFDTFRVLGIASPFGNTSPTWFAVEVYGTNGPFETPEGLLRYNLFLKSTLTLSANTRLTFLGTAYGSQWTSSGQIPARFVDLPDDDPRHLDRFGSIDPTEGGQTQRQMVLLTLETRPSDADQLILSAYGVRYSLRLYNDFTFQANDPIHGDEIEQNDQRYYIGFNALYRKRIDFGDVRTVTTLGAQARLDSMNINLYHVEKRLRLQNCIDAEPAANPPTAAVPNPCDDADVVQSDLAAFAQEDMRFNRYLRVLLGVRADLFEWNVTSKLVFDTAAAPDSNQGTGVVQKAIVNPKLQVVVTPVPIWDLYLDAGGGFHSNDARAVIASNGSGALPRAWGAELGTRLSLIDGKLDLAAALWFLHLQSELVFASDDGTTEASDPTNRYGLDFEARYQILPWLWADLDISLAHAAYTQNQGNGNAVALAPTFTGQMGLSAYHPSGFKGRIGARWVGDRPATPDGSLVANGFFVVDLTLAYRWRFIEVALAIQNLLNTVYREAQFATDSTVRRPPYNETTLVSDINFTPGNPIGAYATVTLFF